MPDDKNSEENSDAELDNTTNSASIDAAQTEKNISSEEADENEEIESKKPLDLEGPQPEKKTPKEYRPSWFERFKKQSNLYLLVFGLIVVIAVVVAIVAYTQTKNASNSYIKSQTLTQSDLNQLANNDVTLGANNNILDVESSAVFAGQVLLKQSQQIAGNLVVGGTTTLNNLNISGVTQLNQLQVSKNLAVSGNSNIQGSETISKNLQVSGSGSFSGTLSAPQITTNSLQINGDLILTHHISTTGSIPTRSSGSALGSGGSVSVNGTDTAGSITINTGSAPAASCFVTINFSSGYSSIPYVLITPVGQSAGGLSYYVTKTTSSFSICDATTPPSGASFGFDYFVIN